MMHLKPESTAAHSLSKMNFALYAWSDFFPPTYSLFVFLWYSYGKEKTVVSNVNLGRCHYIVYMSDLKAMKILQNCGFSWHFPSNFQSGIPSPSSLPSHEWTAVWSLKKYEQRNTPRGHNMELNHSDFQPAD